MNDQFRNYDNENVKSSVELTYKNMLTEQSIEKTVFALSSFFETNGLSYNIWNIINRLDDIVDDSDPDTDLPQIIHCYQTAEAIRRNCIQSNGMLKDIPIRSIFSDKEWNGIPAKYRLMYNRSMHQLYHHIKTWDWFLLVGFIHDLGKVILLPDFGNLPQHFAVGDTFPLGNKLDKNFVFYNKNYHHNNEDLNIDIYMNHCGFDNVIFSWGHDEYLAKSLERNKTKLPREAIYLIRYHSFYSWHTPSTGQIGYKHLANDYDWYMLPLLKCLQKADLYSKLPNIPDIDSIKYIFDTLIDKYIPGKKLRLHHCLYI